MKKKYILTLLLTLSLSACLTGCKKEKEQPTDMQEAGIENIFSTEEVKEEIPSTLDEIYSEPLYGLPKNHQFEFDCDEQLSTIADRAFAVYENTEQSNLSGLNYAKCTYKDGKITVMPNEVFMLQDLGSEKISDGTWGSLNQLYLIQYIDLQTGEELDTPCVLPFSIKHELNTPEIQQDVNEQYQLVLSWEPVADAVNYRIYEYNKNDLYVLKSSTDKTSVSSADFLSKGETAETGYMNINIKYDDSLKSGNYVVVAVDKYGKTSGISEHIDIRSIANKIPYKLKSSTLDISGKTVKDIPNSIDVEMLDGSTTKMPLVFGNVTNASTVENSCVVLANVKDTSFGTVQLNVKGIPYPDVYSHITGKEIATTDNKETNTNAESADKKEQTTNDNSSVNSNKAENTNSNNTAKSPDVKFNVKIETIESHNTNNSAVIQNFVLDNEQMKHIQPNEIHSSLNNSLNSNRLESMGIIIGKKDNVKKQETTGNTNTENTDENIKDEEDNTDDSEDVDNKKDENDSTNTDNKNDDEKTNEDNTGDDDDDSIKDTNDNKDDSKDTSDDTDEDNSDKIIDETLPEVILLRDVESKVAATLNQMDKDKIMQVLYANNDLEEWIALCLITQQKTIPVPVEVYEDANDASYLSDILNQAYRQNPSCGILVKAQYSPVDEAILVEYVEDKDSRIEKINAEIDAAYELAKTITTDNMSDYNKVMVINETLKTNVEYDYDSTETNITDYTILSEQFIDSHTPYGALCLNLGVCESYAESFVLVARFAGLNAICDFGTLNGGSHEWNRVNINDSWCIIDVTNNDESVVNNGLCNVTTEQTHDFLISDGNSFVNDEQFDANDSQYEYYAKQNLQATSLDHAKELIIAQLQGSNIAQIRLPLETTREQAETLLSDLMNEGYIYKEAYYIFGVFYFEREL